MTIVTGTPAARTSAPPRPVRSGAAALAEIEAERAALAGILHDDVLQTLITARWAAERNGDALVGDAVRQAIAEARAALWALTPRTEDGTLTDALRTLADRVAPDRVLVVHADGVPGRMDVAAATLAYRVVQSAVAACSGRTVEVRVELRSGDLTVSIADDGPAYDAAVDAPGSDLIRWLARAGTLDGTARVGTSPGGGTTLWLQIPDALPKDTS
ncbi:MAG: hypothetical protein QOE45_3128 [Frankiaceae bacterium]|jgi:signal transduction histidine kinase|nr:hypothetical protein [Frankiaceae bacterium]